VPKPETDIEYHVSLRSPIFIKLGDKIVGTRSFDAKTEWEAGLLGDSIIFRTDRIWHTGSSGALRDGVSLKTSLTIPCENIAGMVPQPFVER
jgi:hypothetical protein